MNLMTKRKNRRSAMSTVSALILTASCVVLLIAPAVPVAASKGRVLKADHPSWVEKSIPGATGAVNSIQVKSGDPRYLCAVVEGSNLIYSSSDGGSAWLSTASASGQPFTALAASKVSSAIFYALDLDNRVYRNLNSGAQWTQLSILPGPASDIDTGGNATGMVAATGAPAQNMSINYSADGGSNWNVGASPLSEWSLAAGDPTDSNVFYAAQEATSTAPIFNSADSGISWTVCGTLPGSASIHVTAIAVFPNGGPVLIGTDTAGGGQVYRSNDGGVAWTATAAGLPAGEAVLDVSVSNSSPAIAYAATDKGVYASYDQGTTWCDISNNLPEKEYRSVSASGGTANAVFAGAADGTLYKSCAPVVTSLNPSSGSTGDTITITGLNFGSGGAGSYVSFAGVSASIYPTWTDTLIKAQVPAGAMSGGVFVVTPQGSSNSAEFTIISAPVAYTWYLAEGCTGQDARGAFETWVLIANPGETAADVLLSFMTEEGPQNGPSISVPAGSRESVRVAEFVPNTWEVSTTVASDQPIIAERSVYWSAQDCFRRSATDSIGVTSPATTWYLAEGCTGQDARGSFETWVLVQNPGTQAASVVLTYMTPEGPVIGPYLIIAPGSRKTFNVADTLPNCWSVSTTVTSDVPVVAERSMYFNTAAAYRQAATDSIGARFGSKTWYLAEGCTGIEAQGAFETWVLVQNPRPEPANAQLTYMTPAGPVTGPAMTLEPNTRKSVSIADVAPNTWDISTMVTSDQPVIAERAIYWSSPECFRNSATDSIGVTSPATSWCLAEGCAGVNDQGAFETWVLVQNPGSQAAYAHVTYMTGKGEVEGPTLTLPPNSRQTVNIADVVPGNWNVSTSVTCDVPVIVERSMYWNAPGALRQAAHDSIGVAQ